ncbi:MAG: formylglycine-generating enzyme family protein, partial [Nitrospira sp.]
MDVRLIVTACIAGVVTLSLQAGFAATESWAAKPESVPSTSLKSDPPPVSAKPPGSSIDSKAGERSKSPTNGGAAYQLTVLTAASPEIMGKDGAPMVLVPAGEFVMGSDKGDEDEAPVHRVYLNAFYIDKFEVTNGRFAKYVEAIQSEPPWGFTDKETPV